MSQVDDDVVLVLPDGTQVLKDGTSIKPTKVEQPLATLGREIQSGRRAVETLEKMHRKLGDLPDTPEKLNPIAAIVTYTAIGLTDADIATALGAQERQIATIKETEAYKQIAVLFDKQVFEDERRHAKHILARASNRAATRMVEAVDDEDPNIAVVASRDVLRMAGVSAEEDKGKQLGGLRIEVITKDREDDEGVKVTITGG